MVPLQDKSLPDLPRFVRLVTNIAVAQEMPFMVDGRPVSAQTVGEATGLLPVMLHAAGRTSQAACARRDLFTIVSDPSALTGYRVEELPPVPLAFIGAIVLDIFEMAKLDKAIDLTHVTQLWMDADKAEYMPLLTPRAA